jgi:1-acyl-sn-glycerol-3-phosphate acyltransferase
VTARVAPSTVVRSALFALAVGVLTVVWALLSLASVLLPYRKRYWFVSRWNVATVWLLRTLVGMDYRIEGTEHIPDTPCIVFCKHESAWETIILPIHFAPQTWVLKRELLWLPFFGWGLALLAPIAIDRRAGKTALQQIVEQGRERLARGAWVVVFPEGTRVKPGTRTRYKLGGASLAAATGSPVLPIAVNSGDYWGRNSFIKHAGTVRMVIGPLIDTRGLSAGEINRRAETWIEDAVQRIRTHPSGRAAI